MAVLASTHNKTGWTIKILEEPLGAFQPMQATSTNTLMARQKPNHIISAALLTSVAAMRRTIYRVFGVLRDHNWRGAKEIRVHNYFHHNDARSQEHVSCLRDMTS